MRCPRCLADPKPAHFGSPRRCAFDVEGFFCSDNWNCATLALVLDRDTEPVYGDDQRFEYTPVPQLDDEDCCHDGWVITSRYKSRGRTDSAIWIGTFYPPRPFTLAIAERIIGTRLRKREARS